jgi:arylsulfatase A-like enzyme
MRPPNMLLFMTDHQRADTVLPEHPCIAPRVSQLGQDGVTFTHAFCPSPHCCPSRATFHTGLYPSRHGVWNNVCNRQALSLGLKPGVRCWSEDLAAAGYRLHFSGKWHVSVQEGPADRGWTEHFVTGKAGDLHGTTWDRYRQLPPAPAVRGEGQVIRPGYGTWTAYGRREPAPQHHDETAVGHAVEALGALARGPDPWCLYVGLIAPHDPYVAPGRHVDRYRLDDVPLPASYADTMADKPNVYRRLREEVFGQLTPREVREAIRHFWAYCSYIDELFGRVLDALERTGQAGDTLVLFCSDHGDYGGEHGLFAKGIPCFQGAYRVPMVVRWPAGLRRPGRRVAEFVSLADVGPSLLDLAGLRPDRPFSGSSFAPFLRGETPPAWRDEIHTQCNGVELYYTQRSVTTRTLKYVFNGFDRDELYDLRTDPDETVNLCDRPEYAAAKRDLCGRLWRFACREDDTAINPYITVSLAPYGPATAFEAPQGA